MRTFLLSLALMTSAGVSNAYAGTFETCQKKETDATGLRTCIEAARNKAANLLRDQNETSLKAVEQIARDKRDPALVKQYRAQQASHVRNRIFSCRKKPTKNEQVACEADRDLAHLEKMKRYTAD